LAYLVVGFFYYSELLAAAPPFMRTLLALGFLTAQVLVMGGLVWLLRDAARRRPGGDSLLIPLARPLLGLLVAVLSGLASFNYLGVRSAARAVAPSPLIVGVSNAALAIGGACALLIVLTPFVANLALLRWRRIFAVAKLSFKEAVRRRVLWAFSLILI